MTAPSSSNHSVHNGEASHDHRATGHDERTPTETTTLIPKNRPARTPERTHLYYDAWAVRIIFIFLSFIAAISTIALVFLILNTGMSSIAHLLPPHRGSRLLPAWFALISTWISLSAVMFFGTPSALTRVSLFISLFLLVLDIILLAAVKQLRQQENALTLSACGLAILAAGTSLGASYLVQNMREKEGAPIRNGAETVREAELRARLYVAQENYWSNRVGRALKVIVSFVLVFVTSIALFLITFDICITAVDSSVLLPFKNSKLHTVQPDNNWSYKVHLSCSGPTSMAPPPSLSNVTAAGRGKVRKVPTVLYESMRGVPGSLGGEWVVNLRETGQVGRVCVWDRPGYGFSDSSASAEMGHVSDALWQALEQQEEEGPYVLVGAGYGGLLTRLFASRHPETVHSLVYIDSETSHTFFLTRARRNTFFNTHLPILTAPLGLSRIVSLIKNHTPRVSRVLANVPQHTAWQNPRLLSTLLQEQYLAHSRQSPSFRDLLETERRYPSRRPTIVLSSGERVSKESEWRAAQERLWEEVIDEKGRVRWQILEDVGHDVCAKTAEGTISTGLEACENAVVDLVWKD